MINYKIQTNYKIKIKHKAHRKIATKVQLKYLTHVFYIQDFISQTI